MIQVDKVPVRDWQLYFGGVYMKRNGYIVYVAPYAQDRRTVLRVQYRPRELHMETEYLFRRTDLKTLEVWWPKTGAYNNPNPDGGAAYIARKATRSMKKSCCPESHYYLKWNDRVAASTILRELRRHTVQSFLLGEDRKLMTWEEAHNALRHGKTKSVAVSRNLIITRVNDQYGVVYRGAEVGMFDGQDYIPDNDLSPTTKLVYQELIKEGIVC